MDSMPSSSSWAVRAIQLDLARQMETVPFICNFADYAAAVGYNTLVLYLEARVRTASFSSRPVEETYSLEEMARVVRHASSLGLDVIPVVSTLGHCEQFLALDEFRPLAEECDGVNRLGFGGVMTFCPSNEGVYDFLARYLGELATVFTGPHFHVGCDEVFNIAMCPQCTEWRLREGIGAIFAAHMLRSHQIVASLGKRMWMWDDMYEFFPDQLEKLPRDVVLCHWNYDDVIEVEGTQAHFTNRWRQDWLAVYEKMGFDAVICPYMRGAANTETFTEYARRHNVLGGLQTQWEMSSRFHPEYSPIITYSGILWSHPEMSGEEAWHDALQRVLPGASPALELAVRNLVTESRIPLSANPQSFLCGSLSGGERLHRNATRANMELLLLARKAYSSSVGEETLDGLTASVRIELVHWELRDLLPRIYDPRRRAEETPALMERAKAVQRELEDIKAYFEPLHEQRRAGMHPENCAVKELQQVIEGLQPAWDRLNRATTDEDGWLVVRLFLPDFHGLPRLRILRADDGAELYAGVCKPPADSVGSHYTLQVPFTQEKPLDAVRFEVWGYGGQGISFMELQSAGAVRYPAATRVVSGKVKNPDAVLRDDSFWAYLGHSNINKAFHNPEIATAHSIIEVSFHGEDDDCACLSCEESDLISC